MPTAKYLIVGSTEPYSGKTSTLLGLARQFQEKGFQLACGQPLASGTTDPWLGSPPEDEVQFLAQQLNLEDDRTLSPLVRTNEETLRKRIRSEDTTDYRQQIADLPKPEVDFVLWEGVGTLDEGSAFGLSLPQLAATVDAQVLLVARYGSPNALEQILAAKERLGDRLLGVTLNDVPSDELDTTGAELKGFLESRGISVLGMVPHSALLRGVSVAEVVRHLNAQVLCGKERLDLKIEGIQIGAMSVNSAVKYFQQRHNTAIVTGGDRADIQLAALETATHCLILTGHRLTPPELVLSRAEEVEIPVISVELDTLTTVEILDRMFGRTPVREPLELDYIYQTAAEHFDLDRLLDCLGVQ
ncbi:phosphotransacetylase family protein [Baaleninema sp.]|uniref:phosphotransacetylase family protein n=1 Tax=Baaleninema sp. TaxID=3101197 RepID=UPI003CFE97AD